MAKRTVELTEAVGDLGIKLKSGTGGKNHLVIFGANSHREFSGNIDSLAGALRGLLCFSCNHKLGFVEKYRSEINTYLDKEHG